MTLFNFRDMYATKFGLPLSARYNHAKEDVERFVKEVLHQHPEFSRLEAEGRALARLDYQEFKRLKARTLISITKKSNWRVWVEVAAFIVLLLLAAKVVHGQTTVIRGAAAGTTPATNATVTSVDGNHKALDVNIAAGGGTGGGPADAAPNTAASESDAARQKVTTVLRLLDVSLGAGVQLVTAKGTQAGGLWVECKVGCAGGATTPSDAFANPTTAGLQATFNMLYNGTTWDRARGDTTNGLWVNCKNGCAGGSSTPSDTFANPTTAGLGMSFGMGWNGTTWDRLRTDVSLGLWVNIKNTSLPVTGTFWQATQPVSGAFWQATQPVSIATMPSTPVTGTFWQATQPVSGTVAATQSGTWTDRIVGNTGATLDAATSQNVVPPTNGLMILCEFNTTPTTITTGNASPCQLDSAGNLIVNLKTALPAGSALIGKVGIDQTTNGTTNAVNPIPATTGGLSTSYVPAAATTNATSVKNAAGQVYHYSLSNTTATVYYLRMYNLAAAPTCSSATGFVESIPIPASTSAGGREREMFMGQAFGTGIAYCITGGATSTDNTAAAVGVHVTVLYK